MAYPVLVDMSRIYLPPPQSKLRLIKAYVKAMDKESEVFACLRQKFPETTQAKVKAGIFVGPQMKKLFYHQQFSTKFYRKRSLEGSWKSLQKISKQWKSGKLKWNNAGANSPRGCKMSLKLHFLHSHLEFFFFFFFLRKHGTSLRWTWRKVPSGYLLNGKEVQWKESKYYGWLLLKS